MDKKGLGGIIWLIVLVILILFVASIIIFVLFGGKNYDKIYEEKISSGILSNPLIRNSSTGETFTVEESVERFDESFVYYILYSIKAYNLHDSFFDSEKPKIEFYIEDEIYNAIIEKGDIKVSKGEMLEEDIIIRTSKIEAVKMIQDKTYCEKSFQLGESSIEMIASKTELASKGYLEIYTSLTGSSITGFFIK